MESKFKIICLKCGSDNCHIELNSLVDLDINGNYVDGETYYDVECYNCNSKYSSMEDSYDAFGY